MVAAIAAAAGGGFWAAWRAKPQKRQDVAAATVVAQIRRIAKLATVEATEAQIVKVDESTPVLYLFASHKNAVLLVKGKVIAGVDLEKADIRISDGPLGRSIDVALPPAEILAIDPTVEFYDERNGWLNPITSEDRNAWLKIAKDELSKAAEQGRVRERATDQAQKLIAGFATAMGYQVTFRGATVLAPRRQD